MLYTYLQTPIGALLLAGDGHALSRISFPTGSRMMAPGPDWQRDDAAFILARQELTDYFNGKLRAFTVPLAPAGTPFQIQVWTALRAIPYGETITYGTLARRIGRPTASRAVGAANGANPLPIILPCHRVIGGTGALTGFGGGLPTKTWLLTLEGAAAAGSQTELAFA
ncbi:methylated-DNA--[protein]-cysteine S-methyltransferase [Aureimonas frigidaquae]|uniref:methylated-DNA--[protein]-cysteine S-methyltransferase n=1 Tax=Aureimonas frigidaquae TaxID=424757 RepID=UPI0007864C8F|nr:methylated-DNA--[protein]-cysteine S-methyltransferase [Aureimonas frigidaquae]